MLQKRWQPRRPPASSPPMPSPGTSDRRAASYLARLREWRRQDRTSLLLRSGSTRVSSVALPRRLPFLNGRCSDDKRAELIIAHGYRRDYLHDHLLTASRAFHRCLAGLDHEPRPTISGARRRKAGALLLTVRFVRGSRPAFRRPHGRGGKLSKPRHATISAVCDDICGGCCVPQKHLRVGEEWAGTDFYEQTVLRARKPHARLLHCNHGLCGE